MALDRFDIAYIDRGFVACDVVVNGRPCAQLFPDSIVDVGALLGAEIASQDRTIFTCTCGVAACGGWMPVRVRISEAEVSWRFEHDEAHDWHFDAAEFRAKLEQLARLSGPMSARVGQLASEASALVWAIATGEDELARELIRGQQLFGGAWSAGPFALQRAVGRRAARLVGALLEAGVSRVAPASVASLLRAAELGDLELSRLLLDGGFASDAVDEETGDTALHIAVKNVHLEVADLLLARGADPNRPDREGWAVLDWALWESAPQAVLERLEAAGGRAFRTGEERESDRFDGPGRPRRSTRAPTRGGS